MRLFQFSALFIIFRLAIDAVECRPIGGLVFQKHYVLIINGLSAEDLQTRCWSEDNDFGVKNLAPNNEQEWGFRVNYLGNTRFTCDFTWKNGSLKDVVVFKVDSDFIDNCVDKKNCVWKAANEGIFLYNSQDRKYELQYEWTR